MLRCDREITKKGFAKINLFLDITGILPGGFHSVNTVMQRISIYDSVTVCTSPDGDISISCNIPGVPLDNSNLAAKAAADFNLRAGISTGYSIHIEKNIPMAAGLAGGSADAAATLLAINELTESPLPQEVLLEIGSRLGSDIPFCIQSCTAFANGKGDILHPFPSMPHCYILVCCAGEGVSTPFAYRLLDDIHNGFGENSSYIPKDMTTLKNAMENSDINAVCNSMYNIFDEPILSVRPVATQVKKIMLESGAMGAMMSGSGPSIFGIFNSEDAAKFAYKELQKYGYTGIVCTPVF